LVGDAYLLKQLIKVGKVIKVGEVEIFFEFVTLIRYYIYLLKKLV